MCPKQSSVSTEYDYAIQLHALLLKRKKIFPIKRHLQKAPNIHIAYFPKFWNENDTKFFSLFLIFLDILKKHKETAESKSVRIVPQYIKKLQQTTWHGFKKKT